MSAEDLPLSVQEENGSSVKPFNTSNSTALNFYIGDQTDEHVLHYGKFSRILRGQMGDGTAVVIKKRSILYITSSRSEKEILRKMKHHGIVGYKYYHEDDEFSYLVLVQVKSTLEEYIEQINSKQPNEDKKKLDLKNLMVTFLQALSYLHQKNYLHGDIKSRIVLIDEEGGAVLIDFTFSEVFMDYDGEKIKDEIYKAGKLAYYILTGGQNYCGYNPDWKISDLEWDFIEWMTKEKKPLKKVLDHPIFWTNYRKLKYLEALSNLNNRVTETLSKGLKEMTSNKKFCNWKNMLSEVQPNLLNKMEQERMKRAGAEGEVNTYPEHVLGLLRFIRNFLQHRPKESDWIELDFLSIFPDLFESVYIFARDKKWNSRSSVENIFSNW